MEDIDVHKLGFALSAKNWFENKGDETLRLDYPLSENSIVFDLGGYKGEFAEAIHSKYGCSVYVFEPVEEFFGIIKEKFSNNQKVLPFCFGLSSETSTLKMLKSENASSVYKQSIDVSDSILIELKSITEFIKNNSISKIDLMKINVEGGEYDILPALISSGLVSIVDNIQVQFHDFVEDSIIKRLVIKSDLSNTHKLDWEYYFIWENWSLK